jgi:hypothetical protein
MGTVQRRATLHAPLAGAHANRRAASTQRGYPTGRKILRTAMRRREISVRARAGAIELARLWTNVHEVAMATAESRHYQNSRQRHVCSA